MRLLKLRKNSVLAVEKELARKVVESLAAEEIKGVKVIAAQVPSLPPQVLREMSDLLRERSEERHYCAGYCL